MNLPSIYPFSCVMLGISILIAVVGQFLFKAGAAKFVVNDTPIWMLLFQPTLFAGFCAYMLSALIYVYVLKHIPLSVAYPSLALGYVLVVLISHFFLGEPLSIFKIAGIVLIVLGVILLWK